MEYYLAIRTSAKEKKEREREREANQEMDS